MKVRGAPAIAISAALSLAVEAHRLLHNDDVAFPFPNADAAANFVASKLEYLKTSRPTAVNLFEAANRLTGLTRRVAATAANGQEGARQVLQAYVAEAEKFVPKPNPPALFYAVLRHYLSFWAECWEMTLLRTKQWASMALIIS